MAEITVNPTTVMIGQRLTYNATGLEPNTEHCFGAYDPPDGWIWCMYNTTDENGNASGSYFMGENLRPYAQNIAEFVVLLASTFVTHSDITVIGGPPPELTITPSIVKIGEYVSFNAINLVPNYQYCVGPEISATGQSWCMFYTTGADGSLSGAVYIDESFRDYIQQIDQFVIIEPGGIAVLSTPFRIEEAPPPPGPTEGKTWIWLVVFALLAGLAVAQREK